MAGNFVFQVNGVDVPTPSKFGWSLQDLSASNSGRTQDGKMQKNRVTQKEKIVLQWNAPTPTKAAQILQMFNDEYFYVTYHCPLTNTTQTKEFYRGDANAPFYWWVNNGLMESVQFDIIER